MVCKKCGSNEVSEDGNTGCCSQCGFVYEDGNMVAEVGFVELEDGTSTVTGQFVSERGNTRFRSRIPGFSRQSREITIEKGNYLWSNFI
jgi:transcription initiation factor TFIIIB Brf1 subunit/transcription initiation factor TFIIB